MSDKPRHVVTGDAERGVCFWPDGRLTRWDEKRARTLDPGKRQWRAANEEEMAELDRAAESGWEGAEVRGGGGQVRTALVAAGLIGSLLVAGVAASRFLVRAANTATAQMVPGGQQ